MYYSVSTPYPSDYDAWDQRTYAFSGKSTNEGSSRNVQDALKK